MKTRLLLCVVAFGWPASCFAQLPITQPPVNPRINLANRNFNPAIAYYGIVRPQIEARYALQQIQQEVVKNQEKIAADIASSGPLPTGHAAQFQTQSLYFQTNAVPVGAPRPGQPGTPGTSGTPGIPGTPGTPVVRNVRALRVSPTR